MKFADVEVQKEINSIIEDGREIEAIYLLNDRVLSELNIRNKYEVSNAIALFLNFDIKGSLFDDLYWFATKKDRYVLISSYSAYDGKLTGFININAFEWYSKVRPYIKCALEGYQKLHGIAKSGWYMDTDNVWHTPSTNSDIRPEMYLHF